MFASNYGIFNSFMGLISQMEKEGKRNKYGITNENGYDGVTSLNIPHKYYLIEVSDGYYCHDEDGLITYYTLNGEKLFSSGKISYIEHGMFLVQEIKLKTDNDRLGYALYHKAEKLTDYIFADRRFNNFNDSGFAILGLKNYGEGEVVVNTKGTIVYQSDKSFNYLHLNGVLLVDKDHYIDLLTNQVICNWKYSKKEITNKECIFVETEDTCIYQINIKTGAFIIHGEEKEDKPKPPPTKEETALLEQQRKEREYKHDEIEKEASEWFKLTRNDVCKCGSGKKFKTCCINTWERKLRNKIDE